MTDYKLKLYDTSGNQQAELVGILPGGFKALRYIKRVNAPGIISVELHGKHELLDDIADKWQVDVLRKPDGGSWATEMSGFYRRLKWNYDTVPSAELTFIGIKDMLRWRHVLYPAATANRSRFLGVAAETVANTIVKYNATTSGTVLDGRKRAAADSYPFTGLSVEADGATGTNIDYYCAWKNLLLALQEICEIGGGDFDIVKTSSTAWQWRWYTGQLGTDKTASVIFGMNRGNMANVETVDDHIDEATVALVAGAGEGSDRETLIVTGDNYAAGNDIEVFVDGREVETGQSNALTDKGTARLEEVKRVQTFSFDTLQVEGSRYGKDYNVGDLVTVINPQTEVGAPWKMIAADVEYTPEGETIERIVPEMKKV